MKLPQFTTRDLLWCVTLIGVGLGCFVICLNLLAYGWLGFLVLWHAAGAAIVAGLFAPFHKKILGAILGTGVSFTLLYLIAQALTHM